MVDIYEKSGYNITNVSNRRSFAVLCRPQNSVGDRIFAGFISDPPDPIKVNLMEIIARSRAGETAIHTDSGPDKTDRRQ